MSQSYQFAHFIFQEEKPDIVIGEPVTGIFNGMFHHLSRKYNSTYLGLMESRISNRIDFYGIDFPHLKYEKTFNELNSSNISEEEKSFARDFIDRFISHKQVPSYTKYYRKRRKSGEIGCLARYIKQEWGMAKCYAKYIINRRKFRKFDYYGDFFIRFSYSQKPLPQSGQLTFVIK